MIDTLRYRDVAAQFCKVFFIYFKNLFSGCLTGIALRSLTDSVMLAVAESRTHGENTHVKKRKKNLISVMNTYSTLFGT